MKCIQSIKQTGNLPSDGRFFICDSRFHESCFLRELKIIILVILCLLNFVSVFLKNWIFQSTSWSFLTKISYYKKIRYVTSSCFERDLKIITLVVLCLLNFVSVSWRIEHFSLCRDCSWQKYLIIETGML